MPVCRQPSAIPSPRPTFFSRPSVVREVLLLVFFFLSLSALDTCLTPAELFMLMAQTQSRIHAQTPTRTRIRLKPASRSAPRACTSTQTLPIGQLACVFAHFPLFTLPFACDTEPRVCEILIIDTPARIVRWTYRSCHISRKLKWMINSCAFVASSATSGSIHTNKVCIFVYFLFYFLSATNGFAYFPVLFLCSWGLKRNSSVFCDSLSVENVNGKTFTKRRETSDKCSICYSALKEIWTIRK